MKIYYIIVNLVYIQKLIVKKTIVFIQYNLKNMIIQNILIKIPILHMILHYLKLKIILI